MAVEIFVMQFSSALVAILAATPLVADHRRWWRIVAFVSVVGLLLNLVLIHREAATLLTRDIIGWIFIAAASPLAVARVSRAAALTTEKIWIRAVFAWLVTIILTGATPFILLLVHCTSGDCL